MSQYEIRIRDTESVFLFDSPSRHQAIKFFERFVLACRENENSTLYELGSDPVFIVLGYDFIPKE